MTAPERLRSRLIDTVAFTACLLAIYAGIALFAEWRGPTTASARLPFDFFVTWGIIGIAFVNGLYETLFPTLLPRDREKRFIVNRRKLLKGYVDFLERVVAYALEEWRIPTNYSAYWFRNVEELESDPDIDRYLRVRRWVLVVPALVFFLLLAST